MKLTHFTAQADFQSDSATPKCYISNLPKTRDGGATQVAEPEDFVLRGPRIDYEGFLDIRVGVITDTATELGMVSAERAEAYQSEIAQMRLYVSELEDNLARSQNRLKEQVLLNAEMIVEYEYPTSREEYDTDVA